MANITTEIDNILNRICVLAKKDNYKYEYKGAKIHIPSYYYFLEIYQQERYDERVSCVFVFNEYSIFFEHVYEAVEKRKLIFDVSSSSCEEYNKKYLLFLLNFFEKNSICLNEFPPKWFLDAVEISSEIYSKNFPDEAARYKNEGVKLWELWGNKNKTSG